MAKIKTTCLRDLLVQKVQTLYDVEHELIKALPSLVEAANDVELIEGFKAHFKETKEQADRLEEVLYFLGEKKKKLRSDAIRGLIKDGEWVIKHIKTPEARDANLIASASYIEHFEMAGYVAAKEWATTLGLTDIADLLDTTLMEERAADEQLMELGRSKLFARASASQASE